MSTARQIRELMSSYGFELWRETNHFIWRRPDGILITTSKTPSDHRVLMNIERDIKRALRMHSN